MSAPKPLYFEDSLYLLDQRKIPAEENYIEIRTYQECHQAIKEMVVRGAPCIGYTGLYGLYLGVRDLDSVSFKNVMEIAEFLISSRPTAVNLSYEINQCLKQLQELETKDSWADFCLEFANRRLLEGHESNLKLSAFGAKAMVEKVGKEKLNILTHCNTGYLACGGIGTALGVIEEVFKLGKLENVWVDETRPYNQGSRLTVFELQKLGIPHTLVTDSCCAHLMSLGRVDAIVVGADRVALNGDTANKLGTQTLSVVAKEYKVPFYVAAPFSSIDLECKSGKEIEIELREGKELTHHQNLLISGATSTYNPSFDVSLGEHIDGVITERGVFFPKEPSFSIKIQEGGNDNV